MMKHYPKFLALAIAALVGTGMVLADQPDAPTKSIRLEMGKVDESETSKPLAEPNFGYEGHLGTFAAIGKGEARCLIVVHQYPDTNKYALGNSKMTYEGTRRLRNVNGYVFKTEWDGKRLPSKVFLSAEKVYFGGGVNAYIAADYREATGWAWKLIPLRRMDVITGNATVQAE